MCRGSLRSRHLLREEARDELKPLCRRRGESGSEDGSRRPDLYAVLGCLGAWSRRGHSACSRGGARRGLLAGVSQSGEGVWPAVVRDGPGGARREPLVRGSQ